MVFLNFVMMQIFWVKLFYVKVDLSLAVGSRYYE